jgi:hypothetical protein
MPGTRILYVPNESGDFRQLGLRRPLANLLESNLIEEVSIFSLQWRIRNGGDAEAHRQALIERVRAFKPNTLLMQHLGSTGLTRKHFDTLRASAEFDFIYHEADPYKRPLHPLPRSAAAASAASDVAFTVGSGSFAANIRRAGASDVRWEPSPFDPERFTKIYSSLPSERPYDVVVVANRNRPRLRGLPNWRDRIAFIQYLQDRFRGRIAIFGNGWDGPGAMGPVSFSLQDQAIQSGWVSANWDHFANEPNYFSNRLPISLAAGSIHATTWHPGYDELFPRNTAQFLLKERTHAALADAIERTLDSTTPAERLSAIEAGQQFSHSRFRQDDQLVRFLNFRSEHIDPIAAGEQWNLSREPLAEL